jgi:asparagine synthase (glutamine-hydrolysing)
MCGFSGFFGFACLPFSGVQKTISTMGEALRHRGPDDHGIWIDAGPEIALVHRRLAVVDLSAAGNQPMESSTGRFILAFNGEIYNHREIRKLLIASNELVSKKVNWRGHSDTETLLVALEFWGIDRTLKELNGMFAFALWDKKDRKLFLARDRIGEKPLYYGSLQNSFVFGSEIKALAAHPQWRGDIHRDSLALFMRYSHVPAPETIYQGIKKILPGHYLVVSNQGQLIGDSICYWSLESVAYQGMANRKGDALELADELDFLLKDAVGLRMLTDVPLGAFLSGGYDSTMIVAQMQVQSSRPVKTFSIGSEDNELDEAKHAAAVAKHLGTDHSDLYVTPDDALSVISKLPQIYDEPFADSSQIPTFLVSQFARRDVTVALSGDGGDELFGGYNRHIVGPRIWKNTSRMPLIIRQFLARQISRLSQGTNNGYRNYLPRQLQYPDLELKLSKLAAALKAEDGLAFYDQLRAYWRETDIVLGSSFLQPYMQHLPNIDLLEQMLFQDMKTYLPSGILTKVDRASMAVSLEARVPFCDHRLIEFSWRVPSQFKVRDGKGKWLLREVLKRYVPHSLMDRPKQGFSVPIAKWLRGPLRDWAESLLNETRMRQEGFLNAKLVRAVWQNHLSGRGNREHDLWCVLMFMSWLEAQKK